MNRLVFDASALVCFFHKERGSQRVTQWLTDALAGRKTISMSVVNWGEAYSSIWKSDGPERARQSLLVVERLPIQVIDADREQSRLAAEIRVRHGLHMGDSFTAALATAQRATIVTSDAQFRLLSKRISVVFL